MSVVIRVVGRAFYDGAHSHGTHKPSGEGNRSQHSRLWFDVVILSLSKPLRAVCRLDGKSLSSYTAGATEVDLSRLDGKHQY